MKKAQFFITCGELAAFTIHEAGQDYVRRALTTGKQGKQDPQQRSIIFPE
jgi:hypothetical protein